jgi:hypothetical protein
METMLTVCCNVTPVEGTDEQVDGVTWWGRCSQCKEMSDMYGEDDFASALLQHMLSSEEDTDSLGNLLLPELDVDLP